MDTPDTVDFDKLPHADDWPDRTTRADDEVSESGQEFLKELQSRLYEKGLSAEVREVDLEGLIVPVEEVKTSAKTFDSKGMGRG